MQSSMEKLFELIRNDPAIRDALKDKSMDELIAFAKEHGIETTPEEFASAIEAERERIALDDLDVVAGGDKDGCGGCGRTCECDGHCGRTCERDSGGYKKCPNCGSFNTRKISFNPDEYKCDRCGNTWYD